MGRKNNNLTSKLSVDGLNNRTPRHHTVCSPTPFPKNKVEKNVWRLTEWFDYKVPSHGAPFTLQLCKGDRGIKLYVSKVFDYLVHQLYAVTGPQWTHIIRNSTDTTTSSRVRVPVYGRANTFLFQTAGNRKEPSYWACRSRRAFTALTHLSRSAWDVIYGGTSHKNYVSLLFL